MQLLSVKKNESINSAGKWMDLENILSKEQEHKDKRSCSHWDVDPNIESLDVCV